MRFATILSTAALASVTLALPTNEWHGESYGGKGKKHEHEVAAAGYSNTTASVDASASKPSRIHQYNSTSPVNASSTKTTPTLEHSSSTPVNVSPSKPTPYGGDGNNEASPTKPELETFPVKKVSPTTAGQYNGGNDCTRDCITDEQAQQGAKIFQELIQNYTADLALSALTPDFEDYTSSVNIIRNRGNKGPIQVNGISFTSRQDFMNAQGSQPQIPFDILNVFHGCDSITVRWQTTDSAAGQPTKANDIVRHRSLASRTLLLTLFTACTWYRSHADRSSHRQRVRLPHQDALFRI